jgi:hypothetical protein
VGTDAVAAGVIKVDIQYLFQTLTLRCGKGVTRKKTRQIHDRKKYGIEKSNSRK